MSAYINKMSPSLEARFSKIAIAFIVLSREVMRMIEVKSTNACSTTNGASK